MDKLYGHKIRILHWSTHQSMTNALAEMDLTPAQGHIMGYLAHAKKPPCPRDLEEAFHLSHPTVSGLLARLEKKGFLEFRPDENDRRVKRICIRPKGVAKKIESELEYPGQIKINVIRETKAVEYAK